MHPKVISYNIPDFEKEFNEFVKKFPFNPYSHPEYLMQLMAEKLSDFLHEEVHSTLKTMKENASPAIIPCMVEVDL